MARLIKLNDIWRMLDDCAPGYEPRQSREYWSIKYKGKTYRSLPKGPHGRRINPDIEVGYVRSLIRHLAIDRECAEKHIDLG